MSRWMQATWNAAPPCTATRFIALPALSPRAPRTSSRPCRTTWSGASVIPRFATLAEQLAAGGNDQHALDTIATVGMRAFLGPLATEPATRRRDRRRPRRPGRRPETPVHPRAARPRGPRARSGRTPPTATPVGVTGAHGLALVGEAASAVWADNLALPFLRQPSTGTEQKAVSSGSPRPSSCTRGSKHAAASCETRSPRPTRRHDLRRDTAVSATSPWRNRARSGCRAGMGDEDTASRLIAEAEAALLPMGAHPLLALVAVARGRTALAADRPAEALAELTRIFTPTDTAYQPFVRGWALADLTEAAVHADGTSNLVRDTSTTGRRPRRHHRTPSACPARVRERAPCRGVEPRGRGEFMVPWRRRPTAGPSTRRVRRLAYGQRLRRSTATLTPGPPYEKPARLFDGSASSATSNAPYVSCARPANAPGREPPTRGPTSARKSSTSPSSRPKDLQQRDRRTPLSLAPHHRHPPVQPVPQTGHYLEVAATRRTRSTKRWTDERMKLAERAERASRKRPRRSRKSTRGLN